MKCLTKLKSVEVDGVILPATHLGLGVNNNIVCESEDKAKTRVVAVPGDDRLKRLRLAKMALEIEQKREANT